MAKKPNYDFEKRKKEMDRKAKKDAKREEKQRRRDEAGNGEPTQMPYPEYGEGTPPRTSQ